MADILIRGMEMPKDGRKHTALLQFLEDGKCRAIVEYSKTYDDRTVKVFETVPLPEGHGRLGDLDALVSKYTEEINKLEEWAKNQEKEGRLEMFMACHLRSAYLAEAKLNIEAAPTIVPAEGGADDGNP